jgi:RNA polymerase sigma-70 factor (ECF subfamily)
VNDTSRQALHRAWTQHVGSGDAQAERELIRALTPVIQASVARTLRRRASLGRRVGQEVEDVTQSVLLSLFAAAGERPLSRWDPARGLDLPGFVALLAARETASILRTRRRNPWTEEPTQAEALEQSPSSAAGPETAAGTRRMTIAVVDRVRARLSERGRRIFDLLFLEERAPEDVCALTGLRLPAVYTWSSRLSQLGREIAAQLEREGRRALSY